MANVPITIIPATGEHFGFVMHCWLRSNRHGWVGRKTPHAYYFERTRPIIGELLKRSKVLLAADPEDTDHLYGFCCYEPPASAMDDVVLHYVWVKDFAREKGIARRLLEAVGITKNHKAVFTHKEAAAGRKMDRLQEYRRYYNLYLGLGI